MRTFILISLSSLLLFSCSSDDVLPGRTDLPANAGAIRLGGVLNGIEAGTRGTGPIIGTKPATDLSLDVFRADATSGTTYDSSWTSALTGTMAANTGTITLNPEQYYLTDPTRSTKLIALYPSGGDYNASARTVTYTTLDGSTDIMYGAPIQGSRDAQISSDMSFTHLLTQVRVKVAAANNTAITAWGNVTGISIANKKTRCIVQLPAPDSTDPVSVGTTGTPDALPLTGATGGATAPITLTTNTQTFGYAMFLPVTTAEALTLTIATATGGVQTLTVGAQKYEAGKAYEITVNFNLREITATATLTDWNENTTSFTFGAPSNCYMLKPGGHTIAIPISRAYEFPEQQLGKNDSFTAEWLWADAPDLITITKTSATGWRDYIYVTSGEAGNDGNAVVALKNTSGDIVWSWHIWVTDYEPDPDAEIMDRHLGATGATDEDGVKTYGNLYQWGRKDPFPRPDNAGTTEPKIYSPIAPQGFAFEVNTSVVANLGYATHASHAMDELDFVRKPVCLRTSISTYIRHETHWSTSLAAVRNPCPTGWRVSSIDGPILHNHVIARGKYGYELAENTTGVYYVPCQPVRDTHTLFYNTTAGRFWMNQKWAEEDEAWTTRVRVEEPGYPQTPLAPYERWEGDCPVRCARN